MKSNFFNIAEHEDRIKLVGFFVGEVRYGIDIMQISEIVNPGTCVPVPTLPAHIIGMADHRGTAIPIIDLRIRFQMEEAKTSGRTKWILVKVDGRDFGLQVDRVTHVLKLGSSQSRNDPMTQTEKAVSWIDNVFADEDGLVFQLDLKAVTSG